MGGGGWSARDGATSLDAALAAAAAILYVSPFINGRLFRRPH
jgi:hypothetical protein